MEWASALISRVNRALGEFLSWTVLEWILQTAAAGGVLVAVWYGSRLLTRPFERPLERRIDRPSLARALLRGVRIGVVAIGVFIALGVYGVKPRNLALAATALTAGAGVVIAPIVQGWVEGLSVLSDSGYEVGDMVALPEVGQRGFIESVTLRYTKIFTLDNTFLVIPNEQAQNRDIVNESAEDPRTWLSLNLLVTYESDLEEARAIVEQAASEVDEVLSGEWNIRIGSTRYASTPTCVIDSFADTGVSLRLVYWVGKPYASLPTRSAILENIRDRFTEEDVEFAYPHTQVIFEQNSRW